MPKRASAERITATPASLAGATDIVVPRELLVQFVKLADAAECHETDLVDAEFLADQVKMTRRAIAAFVGGSISDLTIKLGDRHPHLAAVRQREHERVKQALEQSDA